ncbi:AAA family ATPase [Chryseobacterium sp. WLY505]|uniref:AAA family ATPase n=1 Tax=Chryseobacterium sp. WLY505 TaxID=3068892 RepID=UPI002796690B|nr:AAA family ATPase [Chryseobacterium sp. WLY505]MDQ1858305.1 AAA family ATPase [Chryseobacterium sp. WLY505]
MDRDLLIDEFLEWSEKQQNYKKGYKGILKKDLLKRWDEHFFDNNLFDVNIDFIEDDIARIKEMVYNNNEAGWKAENAKYRKGAPQAILGNENYLKFLKEKKPVVEKTRNYYSYKTSKTSIDLASPDSIAEFEFDGIYQHENKTNIGDIIFFNQHGDKPAWPSGLSAICIVTAGPHSKGYDANKPNNFKVTLKPIIILPRVLSRKEFIGYFATYNISFIGPMIKNEQNQANAEISTLEAKNLVGILIDIFPELKEEINAIFGDDFYITNLKAIEGGYKDLNIVSNLDLEPNPISEDFPKNLILYGAPGTGKSYEMNKRANASFPNEFLYKRVTFHSSYSYRNFVGTYKPKSLYKQTDIIIFDSDRVTMNEHKVEPVIEYAFEPGPFLILYERAVKNPDHNFLLLIEELNRANTTAVFGELFQLLDRNDNGESEYPITLEASIYDYLRGRNITEAEIKIPSNFYIWATMNNADQGVLPLDTAFKRRWSFEHLGINKSEAQIDGIYIKMPFLEGKPELKWNTFRRIINQKLLELGIHEDKLVGPFFLNKREITNQESVKNKLLLYLKEDVLRYKTGIFKSSLKTFSEIAEEYDKGNNVFDETLAFE